jgi:hypothetical protein
MARYLISALLMLLITSCSNKAEPAKQQLDAAQTAVDGAAPKASKAMPEHFKSLERRMKELKTEFGEGNYPLVLTDGERLTTDAKNLQHQAEVRLSDEEKQAASQWPQLSSAVPQMIEPIKSRLAALEGSKHIPTDVNVPQAQASLTEATTLWDKATAAHTAGDLTTAVASAKSAQGKAQAAADALKLKLVANRSTG